MRIEVNLLGGARRARKKAGAGLRMPDFGRAFAQVKDPLFIGAVVAIVAAVLFIGSLFTVQQAQLAMLRSDAERLRVEARRYQNLILAKRQAERLRDSLVAELTAIREIDGDRYIWPHVMEEVTRALPDYSWLVSLQHVPQPPMIVDDSIQPPPPPVRFEVAGRTSEIEAYTRFLRRLAASPWFTNVVEGPATTVVEEEKAMRAFSITATFQEADSAFIRTVPVIESVR
jgi:Tfp pilus assembly protein PilN